MFHRTKTTVINATLKEEEIELSLTGRFQLEKKGMNAGEKDKTLRPDITNFKAR